MVREQIITKIQNLLNKTEENGCSSAEAATAIAMAQRLMAQHGITLEETEIKDEMEITEEEVSSGTKSVSSFQWHLAKALSSHFACEIVKKVYGTRREAILMIGERYKVDTFKECYNFAYNAYQKLSNIYLHKTNDGESTRAKAQLRWDYFNGFVLGLTNELVRSENEHALVISKSKELKDHMDSMSLGFFRSSRRRTQSEEAQSRGYSDGAFAFRNKNTAIHNGQD